MTAPLLLTLAFDTEIEDVLRSAASLARAMEAPLAVVHTLPWLRLESDVHVEGRISKTRETLLEHLAPTVAEGLEVLEPIVHRGRPDEVALEVCAQIGAQMIITGGGGPANVRRWVLGSTAERIVRASAVPVFVARGIPPSRDLPILCPIDLTPHSRAGLHSAIRMARLFGSPLLTLTVIPEETKGWLSMADLEHALAREEEVAEKQVREFVGAMDLGDLEVEHRVVMGNPAIKIVEASNDAWLLAMASRSFNLLKPTALGGVTERAIRMSRCSLLALRDDDPSGSDREIGIRQLALLKKDADGHLEGGRPERALPLLELAAVRAPANALLQERLADTLDALGRGEEAAARRKLATIIRNSFA